VSKAVELLYDASHLHPGDLLGILVKEQKFTGILNNYPVRRCAMPYESMNLPKGDNRTIRVYVKDEDLNIVDLAGATVVLTVKEKKPDASAVFSKSTAVASEGVIAAADEGEVQFYIVPADTSSLTAGQYVYDVEVITSASKRYTVLEGVINLRETVN